MINDNVGEEKKIQHASCVFVRNHLLKKKVNRAETRRGKADRGGISTVACIYSVSKKRKLKKQGEQVKIIF